MVPKIILDLNFDISNSLNEHSLNWSLNSSNS